MARDHLGGGNRGADAVDLPAGVRLELVRPGARLDTLLLDGTLQAVAHPQPPPAIQGADPRVRRLFADAPAEERAYYQRNGYWPAMHVVAFKETILREHPWVAEASMVAFARAREIAYHYYDDPNWSRLAWGVATISRTSWRCSAATPGVMAWRLTVPTSGAFSHTRTTRVSLAHT